MADESVGQVEGVAEAAVIGAARVPDETAPSSSGRGAILQPLRRRDFRLLFTGETISLIGDQFHFVALAWLALELTGSGLVLGSVLLVAGLPRMVLVLVGGALADRIRRGA